MKAVFKRHRLIKIQSYNFRNSLIIEILRQWHRLQDSSKVKHVNKHVFGWLQADGTDACHLRGICMEVILLRYSWNQWDRYKFGTAISPNRNQIIFLTRHSHFYCGPSETFTHIVILICKHWSVIVKTCIFSLYRNLPRYIGIYMLNEEIKEEAGHSV